MYRSLLYLISGRVWLSGLHCRGNERHITMCISRGWGNYLRRCRSYWSAAGVVCKPKRERRVRLHHRTPKPSSTSTTSTTSTTSKTTQVTKRTPVPAMSNISSHFHVNGMPRSLPTAESRLVLQSDRSSSPAPAPAPIHILQDDPSAGSNQLTTIKDTESTSKKPPMEDEEDVKKQEKLTNDLGVDETTDTDVQLSGEATTPEASKTVPTTTKSSSTVIPTSTTTKTTSPTTKTSTTSTTTTSTTTASPTTTKPRVYNRWIYNREMWRYYMYYRDGSFITSRPDPR